MTGSFPASQSRENRRKTELLRENLSFRAVPSDETEPLSSQPRYDLFDTSPCFVDLCSISYFFRKIKGFCEIFPYLSDLFYASLLLLLKTSTESVKGCLIALAIFAALFIAYTAFLVLSSRKKIDALKAHYCKEKS